jgi:hypothetical protein
MMLTLADKLEEKLEQLGRERTNTWVAIEDCQQEFDRQMADLNAHLDGLDVLITDTLAMIDLLNNDHEL